ncbi:hypothetical protein [Veillonella criceti]|uniref:Uncharacterized protein n=1 Tax=Veillonella criceti TaxID=103891 RepID=A0A380NJ61_9FIRM|nr:hypothetical protein [Veillonella criceti]SUP42252.1 Uncharacterised protein [Veillonella criceti]
MDYIDFSDITDNILVCEPSDILFANEYLHRLAKTYGLSDDEIMLPAKTTVVRLGAAIACRERALAMVGSDTTVMVDGHRQDDIYLQKYKLYADMVTTIEKRLSYTDFAIDGVNQQGKGGVGVISLTRA